MFVSGLSLADQYYIDTAEIIDVIPINKTILNPSKVCTDTVSQYEENIDDTGSKIFGTIVGGLIGSQIGNGNGRLIATAVGAGMGAAIGDNDETILSERVVTRCKTVYSNKEVVSRYRIKYRYGKMTGSVYSSSIPSSVKVRILVTPISNFE
jgi:uncharacterized protein YcfJ